MTPEQIAKVCHEVNRAYCQAIGDFSQPTWEEAEDWQKESAINGVLFHSENLNATPEESHNNWLKEKEAAGWKYGEVKDSIKKEHPCFLPYDQLPLEQKAKDYIFRSLVKNLDSASIDVPFKSKYAIGEVVTLKSINGKPSDFLGKILSVTFEANNVAYVVRRVDGVMLSFLENELSLTGEEE